MRIPCIMVTDDQVPIRASLRERLVQEGYRVVEADGAAPPWTDGIGGIEGDVVLMVSCPTAERAVEAVKRVTAADGEPPFRLPSGGLRFEDLERDLVAQALARTGGNQTRAAGLLGMNRDQIRYRILKFGLSGFRKLQAR